MEQQKEQLKQLKNLKHGEEVQFTLGCRAKVRIQRDAPEYYPSLNGFNVMVSSANRNTPFVSAGPVEEVEENYRYDNDNLDYPAMNFFMLDEAVDGLFEILKAMKQTIKPK